MSTAILEAETQPVARRATQAQSIPTTRLVRVELRKMFNTRSGFWLMASIGIAALLATAATILFAPDDQLTQDSFSAAIGVPMTVILPMVAILAVTSEWTNAADSPPSRSYRIANVSLAPRCWPLSPSPSAR